ncbi:MAG: NTP transferase domain-containing protein, partial [Candidatus Poribacteria bacterium]
MNVITGMLLAGGRSRRMGVDKALIALAGDTVVERVLGHLRECA